MEPQIGDELFNDPGSHQPPTQPSPEAMRAARSLLHSFAARQSAQSHAAGPDPEPEPRLTEGDLCERYIKDHQPTVYAEGRFWRCPNRRRWQPLSEADLSQELFHTLLAYQDNGPPPHPRTVSALLALLRLRLATVDPNHWDNPAGHFPFHSRMLAHAAFEFTDYTPDLHLVTTVPYDYDYDAQAPAWQHFLQTTLPPGAADFLQEFAGYCLLPDNRHELSLWLYGPAASGKATCLLGLQTLLGPFAATLAPEDVAARQLDPAFLSRKHLLVCHEPPLDLPTVRFFRRLVSGQPLTLQRPQRPSVTVQSSARLALSLHTLPSLEPQFESLYHRAALVVFPSRPLGQQDPTLKYRIAQEGPGLYNWARRGLTRLLQRGRFDPPATMLAAAARLRLTGDAPRAFLQQCCRRDPNSRVRAAVLHHAYVAWCERHGLDPVSVQILARAWERLGLVISRRKGRHYWQGIELVADALPAAQIPPAPDYLPASLEAPSLPAQPPPPAA